MWCNLSAQNDNRRAYKNKKTKMEQMSKSDIMRGNKMSELCRVNKYRACFNHSKNNNEKPSVVVRKFPDKTKQTLFGNKLEAAVTDYFTQNEVRSYSFDYEEAEAKILQHVY